MSENDPIDPNTVRELERARADLKSLRDELKTARTELTSARTERDEAFKSRDDFKGQLAQQKTDLEKQIAEAAAASEAAKAESLAALAEARATSDRAIIAAEAKAVATRLGAHNPEDVVRLVDLTAIKRGDDGKIEGLEDTLKAAKESRAYLFGEPPKTGAEQGRTTTTAPAKPGAPESFNARTASDADYAAQKAALLRG